MTGFEWRLPTRVVFGPGRFGSTHKLVRGLGKRAFVVTSRSFGAGVRRPILDDLLGQLARIGVETAVFGEIAPNPDAATVDRAAARAREFDPRYVLALGGGSVMDAAKGVALVAVNGGSIADYVYRGPGRPMKPFNNALPVVCIPTVAATGSEASIHAVFTHEGRKSGVFSETLLPRLAIVDPELSFTVGPPPRPRGAFDMITHVLETYLSTEEPAPVQDRLTEAFVETVVEQLPRVLRDPRDPLGRAQLSWCATLALSGFLSGREGGWPVHALAHGLGAVTGAAHGQILAMILPRMMAFDAAVIGPKIERFNARVFGRPSLEEGLVAFMRSVGAWTTLSELVPAGAKPAEVIESAVEHALSIDGVWKKGEEPYLANIRPLRRADAVAVLQACEA